MAIITLAELKVYLGQLSELSAGGQTASDMVLNAIIPRAESIVLGELGPDFVYAAYGTATQKAVFSDGTSALFLPPHEAGSITAVRYGSSTATVIATTEYAVDSSVLYVVGGTGIYPTLRPRWSPGVYYVTAKWGVGLAGDSVKEVCLQLCVNLWQARGQPVVGSEDRQFVLTGALTTRQKDILAKVRMNAFGGIGIA